MRWTRFAIICLCLGILGYLVLHAYLLFQPLIVHPPKEGIATALVDHLFQPGQNIIMNVSFWVLLSAMVIVLLLVEIDGRVRKSTNHGSAHRANRRDLKPFTHAVSRPPLSLPRDNRRVARSQKNLPSYLVLGTSRGQTISLTEKQQESNILLTAPIGAGKSSRIIIPNLLREQGNRSLFISDVKGELVRITAGAVSRYHEVWVFAPMHPQKSVGYNPLAFIQSVEDAQELASCWVRNTGKSEDDFWPSAAIKLMTATVLHLKASEPAAPFSHVVDIIGEMPYEAMKKTLTGSPSAAARTQITAFFDYMSLNPKLVGSLMTDIGLRFQLLASDHIRAVTTTNQIDFSGMVDRPIAFYLSIPRRYAERYQPLLACLIMQMFSTWEQRAELAPNGQLPRGMMAYLDEFANLGYIPNLSGYISTARSSRVALLMVLQSFNQLDEKYGVTIRKNILTNTTTHLLLPGAGQEETEYYSRRGGDATLQTATRHLKKQNLLIQDVSWTSGETGRPLLTADELRRMQTDEMLMINSAVSPLVLETTPYYKDRRLARLATIPYQVTHVQEESQPSHTLLPIQAYAAETPLAEENDDSKDTEHFLD